ncbi:MAG TPA: signal peptide peptidase SppA [Longimicrobiales bacterium]|nr:signal peptide peptidase SppA [Longimicrobiales bacterium]
MSRRSVITTLAVAVISLMTVAGIALAVIFALRGGQAWSLGGRIAVLDVEGIIDDDEEFLEDLRRFREDPSVRGYVVNINSPGGVVAPSQSIYQELRRIRDEDEVPVVASIGGVGASGGYYIALAADSIFALPGSITGSIGVIMEIPDASELMAKVGVRMQTVMSAEHKDVGSPFRPLGEGDRAILDSLVLDVYAQFVDVVAMERGLERAQVVQVADGRILSGRQALEQRLIDGLGNRRDALATAGRMAGLGDDPRVVRPPEDRVTFWDLILGSSSARVLARLTAPLDPNPAPRVKYVVPW